MYSKITLSKIPHHTETSQSINITNHLRGHHTMQALTGS